MVDTLLSAVAQSVSDVEDYSKRRDMEFGGGLGPTYVFGLLIKPFNDSNWRFGRPLTQSQSARAGGR